MFNTGLDLDLFQGSLYSLTNINSHREIYDNIIFENLFAELQTSVPFEK